MAPTEEPTTKSKLNPASTSACNMPTWTTPRLPPPARTNAVEDCISGLLVQGLLFSDQS
ncbi:hypothetical protein D3C78_1597240 [compost metagenome]